MKFGSLDITDCKLGTTPIVEVRRGTELIWPEAVIAQWEFDTKGGTSVNAFKVRRESDNVEQVFTFGDLADGSYDTFISGSNGAIVQWYGSGGTMIQPDSSKQPLLFSDYVYDHLDPANLYMNQNIDMSGDWVVYAIIQGEENLNNQRLNIGIRGSGSNLFAVQLDQRGFGMVVINRLTGSTGLPDYKFNYNNDGNFKLFTFSYINGVFELRINNSLVSLTPNDGSYTITEQIAENQLILGSRSTSASGKITKYKYVGLHPGTVDITEKGTELMTKYNI